MLTKLGQRGYSVGETQRKYVSDEIESDSGSDPDPETDQITVETT